MLQKNLNNNSNNDVTTKVGSEGVMVGFRTSEMNICPSLRGTFEDI